MQVHFVSISQDTYDNMITYEEGTFYYTGTNVYLGSILLSNSADIASALAAIANNTQAISALEDKVGDLDKLDTTNKDNIVDAINEVYTAIGTGGTASAIRISEQSSDDYAKVYDIYQGDSLIGTINVPKDLVVQSGEVEVNPEGHDEGTYIVLTLANSDDQKIYINVSDLIDIYTAAPNAVQVQLAVNGTEISATLVAGGVGTTELADSAVTTDKIANNNVTLEKLSSSLQESITKAENSVQTILTGSTKGTISVDGTDIAVAGLGSAAYEDTDAFDAAGAADDALTAAQEYADSLLTWKEY